MERTSGNRRGVRARNSSIARALALAAVAAWMVGACDDPRAERSWPAGTILAVDDVPIDGDQMAADVATVQMIEPQWTERQLQRLAFNEITLPRAVMRALSTPERIEAARRELDATFARVVEGAQFGPPTPGGALGSERSGTWRAIGLAAWGAGMSTPDGEWSSTIEEPGGFLRVRVLERTPGPVMAAEALRLDVVAARFELTQTAEPDPDTEFARHRLWIVDPRWEAILPERTKRLMGASKP